MIRLKYPFLFYFAALTLAAELEDDECPVNIPGYTHHGDCNLLCREASWTDITVFYLGNYVAHAATVNTNPGQPVLSSMLTVILVILFPGAGILQALLAIYSKAVFAPTELQQAARAGALCVVKKEGRPSASSSPSREIEEAPADSGRAIQQPQNGTIAATTESEAREDVEKQDRGSQDGTDPTTTTTTTEDDLQLELMKKPISLVSKKLHGICELPEGYYLATLPQDATFADDPPPGELNSLPWTERGLLGSIKSLFKPRPRRTQISCSYNLVKIAASVGQLLFACATLYRIRGDQIARFGYAAFSLTVAQYAWMSFLNLLGNTMRPEYPTMFLVESETLDSLRDLLRRKCQESEFPISGTIGRISPETEEKISAATNEYLPPRMFLLAVNLVHFVWRKSVPTRWRRFCESNLLKPAAYWLVSFVENSPPPRAMVDQIWGVSRARHLGPDSQFLGAIPIAIIGGISRFSPGASKFYQRAWIMTWFAFGVLMAPSTAWVVEAISDGKLQKIWRNEKRRAPAVNIYREALMVVIMAGLYSTPAIGGFVVVGQMIRQYGVCTEL